MQGFILAAITDVGKTKLRIEVNVHGRTEIWTPISHPAISRCDKKQLVQNRYAADKNGT